MTDRIEDQTDDESPYTQRLDDQATLIAAIKMLNISFPAYPDEPEVDSCHILRMINPLLESDVDAPVRMRQALNFLANFFLCCQDADRALTAFDEREGLGWLLLTIATSMEAHQALLLARPELAQAKGPEPVDPELKAKRQEATQAEMAEVIEHIRLVGLLRARSTDDRALLMSVLTSMDDPTLRDQLRVVLNGGAP